MQWFGSCSASVSSRINKTSARQEHVEHWIGQLQLPPSLALPETSLKSHRCAVFYPWPLQVTLVLVSELPKGTNIISLQHLNSLPWIDSCSSLHLSCYPPPICAETNSNLYWSRAMKVKLVDFTLKLATRKILILLLFLCNHVFSKISRKIWRFLWALWSLRPSNLPNSYAGTLVFLDLQLLQQQLIWFCHVDLAKSVYCTSYQLLLLALLGTNATKTVLKIIDFKSFYKIIQGIQITMLTTNITINLS